MPGTFSSRTDQHIGKGSASGLQGKKKNYWTLIQKLITRYDRSDDVYSSHASPVTEGWRVACDAARAGSEAAHGCKI